MMNIINNVRNGFFDIAAKKSLLLWDIAFFLLIMAATAGSQWTQFIFRMACGQLTLPGENR